MKNKIEDMTREEILALSESQIEFLIKFKCATEGVIMAVRPIEPRAVVIPDTERIQAYTVDAYAFEDQRDAAKYMEALAGLTAIKRIDYDYETGSDYKYLKPLASYERNKHLCIEVVRTFPEHVIKSHGYAIREYRLQKEAHDKALKLYEQESKAAEAIAEEVREILDRHRSDEREYEGYLAKFREYMEIANQNFETAHAFFSKVAQPTRETLDRVIAQIKYSQPRVEITVQEGAKK